ncbi:MAG: hypothetical protein EXR98_21470 [Gemmataceae bacterium]|nr:hypothetical protein [Gemmataceae bacterium]
MLYFVVTVSVLHLAWMNWLAYRKSSVLVGLFSAVAPMALVCLMIASPVLTLQCVAMGILVVVCRNLVPDRPPVFLGSSLGSVAVIFGGFLLHTSSIEHDLLVRYPMESMADRMPVSKYQKSLGEVREQEAWTVLESQLEDRVQQSARWHSRSDNLRRLHEETTDNFINAQGFGVMRMPRGVLRREGYDQYIHPAAPIDQPQAYDLPISTESLEKPYFAADIKALRVLHFDGIADFVNIPGLGYIKDREHVAGFRSHEFSKIPEGGGNRVQRVDLVSLFLNDKPVVYISRVHTRKGVT